MSASSCYNHHNIHREISHLTVMINSKMSSMFELVNQCIPQHNTIKRALLQDMNFITNEILSFQTTIRSYNNTNNKQRKCTNVSNCWYFKHGRCWFSHSHPASNMSGRSKNNVISKTHSAEPIAIQHPKSHRNEHCNVTGIFLVLFASGIVRILILFAWF